jgi:hypothetical protein
VADISSHRSEVRRRALALAPTGAAPCRQSNGAEALQEDERSTLKSLGQQVNRDAENDGKKPEEEGFGDGWAHP